MKTPIKLDGVHMYNCSSADTALGRSKEAVLLCRKDGEIVADLEISVSDIDAFIAMAEKTKTAINGKPDNGVITTEQLAIKMKEFQKKQNHDTENCHSIMDDLIQKVMESLGYEIGMQTFSTTNKWYA